MILIVVLPPMKVTDHINQSDKTLISFEILLLCLLFPFSSEAKSEKIIKALSNKIQTSLITTPKTNEVCFSPNEFCDIKLQRFLESAEKSIDMAIYDINLKSLVDLILEKSKNQPHLGLNQ